MNFAALISGFGAQLACLAAATRVFYALGRDALPPGARAHFTRLRPKFGTPIFPFALASALCGILIFAFAWAGPLDSITDISSYAGDIEIIVYLLLLLLFLLVVAALERDCGRSRYWARTNWLQAEDVVDACDRGERLRS